MPSDGAGKTGVQIWLKTTLNYCNEHSRGKTLQLSEVSYLQNNSLVDGKLCNDVRQQQMTVVLGRWVDTHLRQQTRPCKCHQTTQLISLLPTKTHVM